MERTDDELERRDATATEASAPQRALAHLSCPLCGGPNDCATAQSGDFATPCWCRDATFPPGLLARVPPADAGRACICPACVAAAAGG